MSMILTVILLKIQAFMDAPSCRLLSKMKFYDISGVANKLMESYLRNRYQSSYKCT